jgi:hypothetical protein
VIPVMSAERRSDKGAEATTGSVGGTLSRHEPPWRGRRNVNHAPLSTDPRAAGVKVRAVLAVGLVLTVALFAREMSGSAPRTAGSNHLSPVVPAASVPGGAVLCQPVAPLPGDAARLRLLALPQRGSPTLRVVFTDGAGATVAEGETSAGLLPGDVTIPLRRRSGAPPATKVCLYLAGAGSVRFAGEQGPINLDSERVNGKPQAGDISLIYLRRGTETWWDLVPVLSRRFGLGKASIFGTWTLPVIAALLLCVWVGAVRLLVRELR